MRKYKTRVYATASAGPYPWIPVDNYSTEFNVAYMVFHSGGDGQVSGNIEGTHENVMVTTPVTGFFLVTANPSTRLVADGNITQPVAAIRYRATVVSGSSNITFQLLQSGP